MRRVMNAWKLKPLDPTNENCSTFLICRGGWTTTEVVKGEEAEGMLPFGPA
jgi:hypothetical protein